MTSKMDTKITPKSIKTFGGGGVNPYFSNLYIFDDIFYTIGCSGVSWKRFVTIICSIFAPPNPIFHGFPDTTFECMFHKLCSRFPMILQGCFDLLSRLEGVGGIREAYTIVVVVVVVVVVVALVVINIVILIE